MQDKMTTKDSPLIPFTKEDIEEFKKKRNAPSKEKINDCIIELRKWLAQQQHLPKIDEDLLGKFLFGCKYDTEETKIRLGNYYACKARHSDLFSDTNLDSAEHRNQRKFVHLMTMPQFTKQGYRVHVGVIADPDPEMYSPKHIVQHSQASIDLMLRDDVEICTPGIIVVLSGAHVTMKHIMKWEFGIIRAVAEMLTRSRPESIKGVHFIECTNIIKPLFLALASLLNSKLKRRLSYNDPELLYSQVPKEMLPDEFGGTAGPCEKYSELWANYIDQNRDWLQSEAEKKADLALMPKDNEFAVFQDTFRKLEVD
ncbi:hypothetical protein M8J77_025996 [Diaphorina citri]|nr:hypothetical protein M8J77_025996 [Diaphorina citri]